MSIHLFADGNGRIARLLMNLVLPRGRYPPILIGSDQRLACIDALGILQTGGDPAPASGS